MKDSGLTFGIQEEMRLFDEEREALRKIIVRQGTEIEELKKENEKLKKTIEQALFFTPNGGGYNY